MTDIIEKNEYPAVIPLIEVGDKVEGGQNGAANKQANALASRTNYLKVEQDSLKIKVDNLDYNDVGSDPKGTASALVSSLLNDPDPFQQYLKESDAAATYVVLSGANLPNGYLKLNTNGKIPTELLDIITTKYITVADKAARLALSISANLTICVQVDEDRLYYLNGNLDPSVETNWFQGQSATVSGVSRVFGRTGEITAQNGDYTADQITETATRLFVSPTEKTNWSQKQATLVSGTNIKTFMGQSILGSGNISLTPADINAANKAHTHVVSDITDYVKATQGVIGGALKPGSGIVISYDSIKGETTITAAGGATGANANFLMNDLPGALAGQSASFRFAGQTGFNYMAFALKREAGATGQTMSVLGFGTKDNYYASDSLVFNGAMSVYKGENLAMQKNGNYYQAVLPDTTYGKTLSVGSISSIALVPVMSSNTTPSPYVVDQSSAYTSAWLGWKAFVAPSLDDNNRWSANAVPQWLSIKLPAKTKIAKYTMQARPAVVNGGNPVDWTLQGSNDNGATWTTVDTQTGISWANGEQKTFTLTTIAEFQTYRIYVTKVMGNASLVTINYLNFFGLAGNMILKDVNGAYYSSSNGSLTSLGSDLSAIDINTQGTPDTGAIPNTSFAGKKPLTIVTTTNTTLAISTVPYEQIAIGKSSVDGSEIEKLNSAAITTTEAGTGKVRVAISRDGVTFYVFNGTNWVVLPNVGNSTAGAQALLAGGMTKAVYSGLTTAQWASFYAATNGTLDTLYVAYGLSIDDSNSTATVTTSTLNVDNTSSWKLQTPAEVEIRWKKTSVQFKVIAAGDYKLVFQAP